VQDYIRIWERNFYHWDDGTPTATCNLTSNVVNGERVPIVIRLPIQKNPANFTPVIQSLHDSIETGARIFITIWGEGLIFENDQLEDWRPVRTTETFGRFVGTIDESIYPGITKVGPDGIIKAHFPSCRDYTVEYKVEGSSKKGCSFTLEGSFVVRIYDNKDAAKTPFVYSVWQWPSYSVF
jgi:hypothetical protein